MSLKERLNESLAELIRDAGIEVVEVRGYDDRTEYGGGPCSTCSYEYAVVDISYIAADGRNRIYTYDGSFRDLIDYLSR